MGKPIRSRSRACGGSTEDVDSGNSDAGARWSRDRGVSGSGIATQAQSGRMTERLKLSMKVVTQAPATQAP